MNKNVLCVCAKRKGRVIKLYLYSIIMYSICRQRLYNAHITVRRKYRKTVRATENTAFHEVNKHTRDTYTHLLYNSLSSGLSTELFVVLYNPVFTVGQYRGELLGSEKQEQDCSYNVLVVFRIMD